MKRPLLVLLVVTGCGVGGAPEPSEQPTAEPTPETYDLAGTLALTEPEAFARFNDAGELQRSGKWCVAQTTHGYADIESGTQIVVTDEAGRTLGTGNTVGGVEWGGGAYDREREACVWTFDVDELDQAEFYTLKIGRRNGPTYSFADLESQSWSVALTIGD